MSHSPVKNTLVKSDHSKPISEVTTNTFVINLQQAIFDLETGTHHAEALTTKPSEMSKILPDEKNKTLSHRN